MVRSVPAGSVVGPLHTSTMAVPSTKLLNPHRQMITVDVPLRLQPSICDQTKQERLEPSDCVLKKAMLQNYENFNRNAVPARLMCWRGGAWVDFSSEVVAVAKSAFLDRKAMFQVEVDGNFCIFDFYRMLMFDIVHACKRSIAWIDVDKKCYFPKFFVDDSDIVDISCNSRNSRAKIGINVENGKKIFDSGCGKRKIEERLELDDEDTADSSLNSGFSVSKRRRLASAKWRNARLVMEGQKSYEIVKDLFMRGLKDIDYGVQISSIHQFTRGGPMGEARWEVFNKQIDVTKVARGGSNVVFAWHGTSKEEVFGILAHGFGSPSRVSGSEAHGVGVYVSPAHLPHVSHTLSEADDNGERHLALCRVVLGKVEKVEAGSHQFHPSSVDYDTGVDDVSNPKWYVVWSTNMNTHILPEYVVSYKLSNCQRGAKKGAEFTTLVPNGSGSVAANLFCKLGHLLPTSKVEEVKDLCRLYKAGKMAKELFIKQLRAVVGDQMLLSAISEIRGSS